MVQGKSTLALAFQILQSNYLPAPLPTVNDIFKFLRRCCPLMDIFYSKRNYGNYLD